jgi:predicted acyltransferase (DUF342 family)
MKIISKQLGATLLASALMAFASTASATAITTAAGQIVDDDLTGYSVVTLGAGSVVCGNIDAPTVTLGANAGVTGNVTATTVTTGAGSFVNGALDATTITLGANACYGSLVPTPTTMTIGANAGQFCLEAPVQGCTVEEVYEPTCSQSPDHCHEHGSHNNEWSPSHHGNHDHYDHNNHYGS